jgi:hypothetical protein
MVEYLNQHELGALREAAIELVDDYSESRRPILSVLPARYRMLFPNGR